MEVPYEITINILSYLPVQSLLRFKCVSKSWCSLISCPNFQLSNYRRERAMYTQWYYYQENIRPSYGFINQQLNVEKLNYPFLEKVEVSDYMHPMDICVLWGSCHGLILLNLYRHLFLYNPATRSCTKFLRIDDYIWDGIIRFGGLCYDSSKNDYKALMFTKEFVVIASLKGKKWRRAEFSYNIPSPCFDGYDGITFHGRLHFKMKVKKSYFDRRNSQNVYNFYDSGMSDCLICFDPIFEEFDTFPIPESKSDEEEIVISGLGVLNECLCMTCEYSKSFEILVMKEYGVKESWTPLFFIRNLLFFGFVVPLTVTENGELALIIRNHNCQQVVIYNPKNDIIREILVHGKTYLFITYVESLILPKLE
ncbi:f-boxkelch-repeat protein [Nicotiana attenuata]|uniref:F-boxkelch-repeat protein n=1 Tax=Nicotiana attenuata TaxID=49451 RepID=A0A314L1W6_NICAT|nr:f-boxkelch-repeat protein [Nicotiana attenuata]